MFRLALISFIILFLELALIRLIGTEIRIFAYLSNLILLAIFIGVGLGMFIKKRLSVLISSFLLLILMLILVSKVFNNITPWLSPLSESFIWFQESWPSLFKIIFALGQTMVLFCLVMAIFVPLGQYLGRFFKSSKKIIFYYSLNVLFSLLGIWAFNLLSFLSISPFIGILATQFLLLIFIPQKRLNFAGLSAISTAIIIFVHLIFSTNTTWSPYQKLTLIKLPPSEYQTLGYQLQVNNVGYMGLLDLSDKYQKTVLEKMKDLDLPENFDIRFSNQYDLPFLIKPNVEDVLIIGAGAGNDAAAAIRANVLNIDAVEIDPKIIDLGRKNHPEQPYSHPSVNIFVDDGRSYFKKTTKKYDLVIMGLADSHTLSSSLNNIQLDNYLYTRQGFEEIKLILKPDGLLFVSFDVRRPWIGDKIQANLANVFGHSPLIFNLQEEPPLFGWGGVIFVQSVDEHQLQTWLSQNPALDKFIASRQITYKSPAKELVDDWPYLYLDKPRIPKIHLIVSLFLLAIFLILAQKISYSGKFRWDSFFLGSGFLLYEFQNISKTALLYGNTWMTNVFTISAILVFILIANLITTEIKIGIKFLYAMLFVAFAIQIIIPLPLLNRLSTMAKYILAPMLLNLPLFFSALIFISLFTKAREEKAFFASNLIGSAIGGVLAFLSYAYGIKFLLFVSLLMYLISAVAHST